MMLANLALTTYMDCWCGAEGEHLWRVSVKRVSQVNVSKACLSSYRSHPCKMYSPVLKDNLRLAEHQRIHQSQKLCRFGPYGKQLYFSANIHQYQKQDTGEKPFRINISRVSFVMTTTFMCMGSPLPAGKLGRTSGQPRISPGMYY